MPYSAGSTTTISTTAATTSASSVARTNSAAEWCGDGDGSIGIGYWRK
jgi:hypothetical protein